LLSVSNEEFMNPGSNKIWLVTGLVFGLAMAGCGDSDVVAAYCNLHDYCYAGSDYIECMDLQESQQEEALAGGQICHDAFLRFHECIGELSCSMLDEYYADGAHCGTEYSAWQSRCNMN
jgi:hypothetical protein